MTDKRPSSAKARRECFEANKLRDEHGVYMICHISGARIDPVRDEWEAEHVIAHALGGTVLKPALVGPHRKKTAEQDIPAIAKAKRIHDRHFGIKRSGPKSKFKRMPDGRVVDR